MHERAEADFASDYTMTRQCTWVAVAALPPFVRKLEQVRSRCPLHHLIDDDTLVLMVSFDLDVSTAPGCSSADHSFPLKYFLVEASSTLVYTPVGLLECTLVDVVVSLFVSLLGGRLQRFSSRLKTSFQGVHSRDLSTLGLTPPENYHGDWITLFM